MFLGLFNRVKVDLVRTVLVLVVVSGAQLTDSKKGQRGGPTKFLRVLDT